MLHNSYLLCKLYQVKLRPPVWKDKTLKTFDRIQNNKAHQPILHFKSSTEGDATLDFVKVQCDLIK